ncbi:MAG: hypothetical protein U0694_13200 [Anaerolineae bacterium]
MHLTLWQQFSSNHSAWFTVVGQFQDTTAALKAAAELRHILAVIAAWNEAHPELQEMRRSGDFPPPTEPEVQFSKQYGVAWDTYAIPWFWQAKVTTHENLVFLDSDGQASGGAFPFNDLLTRLGGQVYVQGDIVWNDLQMEIFTDIAFMAPDDASAEKLYQDIGTYLAPRAGNVTASPRAFFVPIPWELYGTQFPLLFSQDFLTVFHRNPHQKEPAEAARQVYQAIICLLGTEPPDEAHIKNLITVIRHLTDYGYEVAMDADALVNRLDDVIRGSLFFSKQSAWGRIERDGRHLRLRRLQFTHLAHGLPALLRYLIDKGCIALQVSFTAENFH